MGAEEPVEFEHLLVLGSVLLYLMDVSGLWFFILSSLEVKKEGSGKL